MAEVPGSLSKVLSEEVDGESPLSESVFFKVGSNINALIDRAERRDFSIFWATSDIAIANHIASTNTPSNLRATTLHTFEVSLGLDDAVEFELGLTIKSLHPHAIMSSDLIRVVRGTTPVRVFSTVDLGTQGFSNERVYGLSAIARGWDRPGGGTYTYSIEVLAERFPFSPRIAVAGSSPAPAFSIFKAHRG